MNEMLKESRWIKSILDSLKKKKKKEKHLRPSWGTPANSGKGERPHKGHWDGPIRDTAEKPGRSVQCHRSQGNSVFKMKYPLILMVQFLPSTSQFLERNRSKIFSYTEAFLFHLPRMFFFCF